MLSRRLHRPCSTVSLAVGASSTALSSSSALFLSAAPMISVTSQRRMIRIQDPDPDIKTYWRKETEHIRSNNKGVPLGSAEVQGEALEEFIRLSTANGNVTDSTKLAKWVIGVLFVAFGLPQFIGNGGEQPGCEYTPYVAPPKKEEGGEEGATESAAESVKKA